MVTIYDELSFVGSISEQTMKACWLYNLDEDRTLFVSVQDMELSTGYLESIHFSLTLRWTYT